MAREPIYLRILAVGLRQRLSLRRRRAAAAGGLLCALGVCCLLAYGVLHYPTGRLEDSDDTQPVESWLPQLGLAAIGIGVVGLLVTMATSTATREEAAKPERLLIRYLGVAMLAAMPLLAAVLGLIATPASNEFRPRVVVAGVGFAVVGSVAAAREAAQVRGSNQRAVGKRS